VTGQYYLRARYYNPVIGRFLQEDTYYGDGLNLYAYCRNNPVRYYDPSGHDACPKALLVQIEGQGIPVVEIAQKIQDIQALVDKGFNIEEAYKKVTGLDYLGGDGSATEGTGGARYGDGESKISSELYKKLRNKTPSIEAQDYVNQNINNLIGTSDSALSQIINNKLEADHIVSMKKVTAMEGFDKLSFEEQVVVLNNLENFTGLTKTANTSKGSKSYSEWTLYKKGNILVNPVFSALMVQAEIRIEGVLQNQIDDLVNKK